MYQHTPIFFWCQLTFYDYDVNINYFPVFRLREGAIEELKSLGSSAIQNLGFRDVWYFVGQKGIEGYTELEEVWHDNAQASYTGTSSHRDSWKLTWFFFHFMKVHFFFQDLRSLISLFFFFNSWTAVFCQKFCRYAVNH